MIERLGFIRSLIAAFSVVGLLLLGASMYTWTHLDSIAQANSDAAKRLVPQLARMAAIELNITRVSLQARHAMLARTPEELRSTLDDIGAKRKTIDEAVAGFQSNVHSERGKQLIATVQEKLTAFWTAGETNLGMTLAGNKTEAFEHLVSVLIPARQSLLDTVAELRVYQQELLDGLVKQSEGQAQRTKMVQAALNVAIAALLSLTAWQATAYVRRRIGTASRAAACIAEGDLASTINAEGNDEFRPMLLQMREMQAALQGTVSQVRAATQRIATASVEIASGNQDLSSRTELAASNLQQTSNAMEQLTANVQQSADSARLANQLASTAAEIASRGGSVVNQVVATMEDIRGSSRKISDIIGVIDGIAFQTNILALNAAVEAARAGEQGRGFAVVASEVRSLAQRSAEAAKEIKTLIGASVDSVESGNQLVAHAGQTMTEIVGSVQRVSGIVQEIAAASSLQSQSIGQVNGSVAQLDQMTQQNAALVEQSAAAAESLKAQAQSLSEVVGVFKLSQNELLR
jgi:methyl-accepting chemotaxis protein